MDTRNTLRLKEIIAEHGWPGRSRVGDDGASAAWLLVQHADLDRAFQKECVALMEAAVQAGKARPADWAYLVDRVRVGEGKPQVYGTQFMQVGDQLSPQPIEDPEHVDERRAAVGLGSLANYAQSFAEGHKGMKVVAQVTQLELGEVHGLKLTGQIQCFAVSIKPGNADTVREWFRTLSQRADVAQFIEWSGQIVSSVFVDRQGGRDVLVFYSRAQPSMQPPPANDTARDYQTFMTEHLDMMDVRMFEPLYDVDRIADLQPDQLSAAQHVGAHGLMITGEVQCLRIRIKPGKTERVSEYFKVLNARDDVADALRAEGILVESLFLDHAADNDHLLFYVRAENLRRSNEVFTNSLHPVDVAAREFMNDAWDLANVTSLEMIYDVDRIGEVAARR